MPPGRRKGAKKSTATVDACRQWNVGDLVLAKVKGFPPWPAMVSEAYKWHRRPDPKKVFVLFFGTKQIAFCNPADIEEFTEEKKQFLAQRQGRGTEFVRAVKEIIRCYEKRLNEGTQDDTSSDGEVADIVNSPDPSTNSGFKDQVDTPWKINSQMKSSNSVTGKHELVYGADDDLVVAPRNASYRKDATAYAVATATVKSLLPVKQESEPVQRSRRSSQIQNFVVRRSDGGNNDTDSSAFASNVSMEENSSEIVATKSDACSLNEGSAIDLNVKLEQSEIIECSEYEVGLNKVLDHEMKAVIGKKKRKPNRKRNTNKAGAQNANQSLQNMSENPKERCSEPDGDEHLPLLKRARVRMAISSSKGEDNSRIAQAQEKSCKEVIIDSPSQIIIPSNCENSCLADGDSSALNGVLVNVSPKLLAPCSENGFHASKVKKDQLFGFSVDDESFLPPSKRINRALKAMSANAAEQEACTESPPSVMTSTGRCCLSPIKRCSCMIIDNQGGIDLEPKGLDSCGIDCSKNCVGSFPTCSNPVILTEGKSSIEEDKQFPKSQQHESGKNVISSDARHHIGEDLSDSVVCVPAKVDSQVLMHTKVSPNLDVKSCQVGTNQDSSGPSVPPKAKENIRPVIHSNPSDTLDHRGRNLDPVVGPNKSGKLLPQDKINMPQNVVVVCEDMNRTAGDRSKINDTHDVLKEVNFKRPQEDMISLSISNDCSGEKGALGIPASSSLTHGGVCLPQGSPPNTLVRNVSTSDSSNIHQNGSCSPDVLQKNILSVPIDGWKDGAVANQRSGSTGKSTEAGNAALSYFEAMLGTLTRTKDNIGRVTHIAIDCAKFGIATKVVESLVQSLENEPSLDRRVDLFFLVDSIARCSRGSKGDVGGVYPSAMQAFLPRLLSAAAPPGNTAHENRRQCLKVLNLWLQRRILPEDIILHHIRELNSYSSSASAGVYSQRSASAGVYSQRSLRTERALDDPIREMEGMLVDEYGSNSSFQLSGFRMPCMLKDGGSDSDGGNFEAVTPERGSEAYEVQKVSHAFEKHRRVLEDVDGELEMEDVAPSFDVELNSICNDGGNASQLDMKLPPSFAPRLPQDVPSSSPYPPSFTSPPPPPPPYAPPPPPPPPPPTSNLMSAISDQHRTAVVSKAFTDSQTVHGITLHSVAQPLAAPRNSRPIDAVQFRIPECRDMQMQIPESACPVRPPESSRSADGFTVHNKGYILRPPHRVPSDQFSFVHAENRLKSHRVVPPPPSYSNRHHSGQNMKRENLYDNHNMKRENLYDNHEKDGMRYNIRVPYEERWNTRAAPEDRWSTRAAHDERWNTRAAPEERWNTREPPEERWTTRALHEERWTTRALHEERRNTRAPYSGVPSPYGCHPSESTRSPCHGWRFPSPSMSYRDSMSFRSPFHDAIPVANRGTCFWRPRRIEITRH